MALINIYIHIFQTNFSYFILLKNLFLVVKVLEMSLNKCSMNVNMSNKIVWHNTVHGFLIEKLPENFGVRRNNMSTYFRFPHNKRYFKREFQKGHVLLTRLQIYSFLMDILLFQLVIKRHQRTKLVLLVDLLKSKLF